jgi:hypothetical protein
MALKMRLTLSSVCSPEKTWEKCWFGWVQRARGVLKMVLPFLKHPYYT